MEFLFTLDLEIDGMHLSQLEGFAIVERDDVDPDDWKLGDIYLHNGWPRAHPEYEERKLTFAHQLYMPVLGYLTQKETDIDWEWGQHLNACKANMEAA